MLARGHKRARGWANCQKERREEERKMYIESQAMAGIRGSQLI